MHILGACVHIYSKYEVSMNKTMWLGGLYTHDTDSDTNTDSDSDSDTDNDGYSMIAWAVWLINQMSQKVM